MQFHGNNNFGTDQGTFEASSKRMLVTVSLGEEFFYVLMVRKGILRDFLFLIPLNEKSMKEAKHQTDDASMLPQGTQYRIQRYGIQKRYAIQSVDTPFDI